ncbi:S-adenosylmethionine sensor upstream of mTORC1 [Anastrepha ludens]|uniref:S-adenosylmethionine sensor upstream of mTORC1 n=1 Tax=Anastrepha ludens TaxID=28586 RepID=UPI0023B049AC|nr:S-adenosylmethionine sensor upstream of mTORC1 [Anastrepha ludens]
MVDHSGDDIKEEHMRLATIIKDCHENLRSQSKVKGMNEAWNEHLQNTTLLQQYSTAMHRLASIWESNTTNPNLFARSRVKWITDYCKSYFFTKETFLEKRNRETRLAMSYTDIQTIDINYPKLTIPDCINVLDVGSCFNPFSKEQNFNVTAIDLCPATSDVLKEYIPSPEERLHCCRKAHELLRSEGILIIITPDSQHVGKNAKLMKNWRYALGTLGFYRICFEKLPHITCMVFRKTLNPSVARVWAELHREDYMTATINIPQDDIK